MDIAAYEVEAEIEGTHWWFAGRRRLFAAEIERAGLHQDATILDIGTSTGTNLRMLRTLGFSNVQGLDASDEAIRFCVHKGFDTVRKGDLCNMPFASNAFDLVLATDVIEHVDDDAQAMTEIARILKPGGAALITVPTFRCLWGLQDEIAKHKRRYRKSELLALVTRSGIDISTMAGFGPTSMARAGTAMSGAPNPMVPLMIPEPTIIARASAPTRSCSSPRSSWMRFSAMRTSPMNVPLRPSAAARP